MNAELRPGERLDDLQTGGLRLIQKPGTFCFGTDSVLLADFAAPRRGERAADLGCGNGAIALLMAGHRPDVAVEAVELQPEMADMARRSVRLNALEDRIRVHEADCREAASRIGHGSCRLVVTNPPYTARGAGLVSPERARAVARSDSACTLGEWIAACGRVLQNGGRLCCVFPAPRLLELWDAMRAAGIEPKRVRFVVAHADSAPKLVLAEGLRGGRPGLHVLPMLITHDAQGGFTQEMRRIYGETD